jgi:pSer/pThr/pTyr-binding forkhead associated (FHA) protein
MSLARMTQVVPSFVGGHRRVESAMTVLIVAVLVLGACVAAPWYLKWRYAQRSVLPPEPVELVFPMPSRSRPTEPRRAEPAPPPDDLLPAGALQSMKPTEPSTTDTVRFRRPADEAVQLLPGRLEVLSGLASLREIRFVRVPGERPEVILGREPGSSPQHVSLPSSTVSRQHARLEYSGGGWSLTNLSRTNPVVVNDEMLSNIQGHRSLADGDRIELGDVVLRFCAH